MEVRDIVQEAGIKTIPKKKKSKKAKWLSQEALQTVEERREVKSKGEKERSMCLCVCVHVCACVCTSARLVVQSCPTLCDPMDCSPPGPSVHGDSPSKNTGVGTPN